MDRFYKCIDRCRHALCYDSVFHHIRQSFRAQFVILYSHILNWWERLFIQVVRGKGKPLWCLSKRLYRVVVQFNVCWLVKLLPFVRPQLFWSVKLTFFGSIKMTLRQNEHLAFIPSSLSRFSFTFFVTIFWAHSKLNGNEAIELNFGYQMPANGGNSGCSPSRPPSHFCLHGIDLEGEKNWFSIR